MQHVLVLNASYEPLNVTTVRRAHVLVFKGKAEVIEELDQPLHSASSTFPWPHVIRLVTYVRVPRAVQRKISRRALFARDGWRCAYCGSTGGRLTLDHIVPRSRGGEDRDLDRPANEVGEVACVIEQPADVLVTLAAPRALLFGEPCPLIRRAPSETERDALVDCPAAATGPPH